MPRSKSKPAAKPRKPVKRTPLYSSDVRDPPRKLVPSMVPPRKRMRPAMASDPKPKRAPVPPGKIKLGRAGRALRARAPTVPNGRTPRPPQPHAPGAPFAHDMAGRPIPQLTPPASIERSVTRDRERATMSKAIRMRDVTIDHVVRRVAVLESNLGIVEDVTIVMLADRLRRVEDILADMADREQARATNAAATIDPVNHDNDPRFPGYAGTGADTEDPASAEHATPAGVENADGTTTRDE